MSELLGAYRPGTTLLHRLPAGPKLAAVALWSIVVVATRGPMASPTFAVVAVAVAAWGFSFGAWLTVVTTWMAQVASDLMEAGGGLVVAGFQLAITLGAEFGGLVVDGLGIRPALVVGALIAFVGAAIFSTARLGSSDPQTA